MLMIVMIGRCVKLIGIIMVGGVIDRVVVR